MCMVNAYVDGDNQKEMVLKEVASLKIDDGKITLETLFGEKKTIRAEIKEIDFANSSVLLKKKETEGKIYSEKENGQ